MKYSITVAMNPGAKATTKVDPAKMHTPVLAPTNPPGGRGRRPVRFDNKNWNEGRKGVK
jgi:hypothetical protein